MKENKGVRMYRSIADNIIRYFHYERDKIYLLVDEAYAGIAQEIKQLHTDIEIRMLQADAPEQIINAFVLPTAAVVLFLAEPANYVKYRLFQYLDFSKGEPQIPNTISRVLIFPKESFCRMFSGDVDRNVIEKERLLDVMMEKRKYRITTTKGTDLFFEARSWIPLDFEICTAPIETSVDGVIVVDGALFYRKIEEPVTFVIKDGKIQSIAAESETGNALVEEYRNMTAGVMKDTVNMQLAEVGIGFFAGAIVSDCFMEAETVLDTCHFCFGNNVCYGGKNESEFHGASILIKNPVFTCIG